MSELRVTVRRREGSLVRLLGLAERRGYAPVKVEARESGDDWSVSLAVQTKRSVAQLQAQLLKLHDVTCVEVLS